MKTASMDATTHISENVERFEEWILKLNGVQ